MLTAWRIELPRSGHRFRAKSRNRSKVYQRTDWGRDPPCGAGAYETRGKTDIYFDGAWRGSSQNQLRSGYHNFPQ